MKKGEISGTLNGRAVIYEGLFGSVKKKRFIPACCIQLVDKSVRISPP